MSLLSNQEQASCVFQTLEKTKVSASKNTQTIRTQPDEEKSPRIGHASIVVPLLPHPVSVLLLILAFASIGEVESLNCLALSPHRQTNGMRIAWTKPIQVRSHGLLDRFIRSTSRQQQPSARSFSSARFTSARSHSGHGPTFPSIAVYTESLSSLPMHTSSHSYADVTSSAEGIVEHDKQLDHSPILEPAAATPTATTVASEYETVFSLDLPEGKCVGIEISNPHQEPTATTSLDPTQISSNENHWIKKILHPDEVQYGLEARTDLNRISFFLGRLAMRSALAQINGIDSHTSVEREDEVGSFAKLPSIATTTGAATATAVSDQSISIPILKDEHGRPQVPNGFIGSISHKGTTGVALVSTLPADFRQESGANPTIGVGVDIEKSYYGGKRMNIARRVLTLNERNDLGHLDGITPEEEVLLRFSLKESVYKAMHPIICEYVGFQEAEIKPLNDGTAKVYLNLKSGKHNMFKEVKAHWRQVNNEFFLTSSKVTVKDQ